MLLKSCLYRNGTNFKEILFEAHTYSYVVKVRTLTNSERLDQADTFYSYSNAQLMYECHKELLEGSGYTLVSEQ